MIVDVEIAPEYNQEYFNMGAWIASGGIIKLVVLAPPPTLPPLVAPSDGESEVGDSDAELPSPRQIVPKVCQADDMEHTLNKGLWVGTGAKRRGWRIYVGVSACLSLFASAAY